MVHRTPQQKTPDGSGHSHRNRWLRGYQQGFGFAYLTLGRPRNLNSQTRYDTVRLPKLI